MKKFLSGSPSVSLLSIFFWCVVNLLRLVELSQAQDATNATTDPSEVSALNSIFQKWGVSAPSSTWNTTGDPCTGTAVNSQSISSDSFNPAIKCLCNFNNGTTCRITQMRVYGLDATGPIPEELGNLSKLFDLNLLQNYLTGPLPAFIGNLTDMQYLSFGKNALSGPIPKEIGKLQKLISLSFESNNFNGSLPPELGNLVNLEQLYMDSSGVGGEIPSTFSNLVNLKIVWASDCPFNGTIPNFIGSWNLAVLRLQGNSFQGSIPSSFSNLTSMTDLRISDISNGSSSLAFISNMKSLSILILRNNMISGTIPLNIGEYQSLLELDLSFNNLIGQIPSSLFNLSSLYNLFLGNNSLSGTLPPSKSSSLLTVDLSYNQLSGSFPIWVTESDLRLNLVANNFVFDDSNSSTLPGLNCLQRNFPCNRGSPIYSSFAVNCGGQSITSSTGTVYAEDNENLGAASYNVSDPIRWAVGNVGKFAQNINATYISTSLSQFTNTLDSELFQTARLSPVSLRYYGLGLENGNYTISLQFAETAFKYSQTWKSVGRRIFDIYVQGSLALKDFDIRKASGGVQFRTVERQFKALVSENHLEIHLFWAGKGTCCIPFQGTYGPSISALSVTPDFTPTVSNRPPTTTSSKKNKTGLAVGIAVPVGVLCLISVFVILIVRRRRKMGKGQEEASMSQDQSTAHSSAASATTPSGCSSRESVPKSITFGEHDQPIGPDAAQLSSLIGNLVRTYVSPIYEAWTNVPSEIKEQIWNGVIGTYNINEIRKNFVMKKANISWKGWKYALRHQAIDKYLTDAERKSNVPKCVKPEDWVKFVDISSTSAALAAREAGKKARSKLKSPHTTGRKGQARVAAELKAKNPDQPLTRTDLFLATHKRKDGSASSPHVDDVITAYESDTSVAQGDLDHDAVTKVFGRDSRGRVRGLGTISKTAIKHAAPYKRALEDQNECNTHLQTEVKRLKESQIGFRREMDELKQALVQGGTQVQLSTYHGSSSQAQDDSSCQLAHTNQPNTNTRQGTCRLLHYVRKEMTVALGRVLGLSIDEEGCYRIVVDEILKFDVELLGGEKTFGDLTVGDIISWPTYRTVFG